MWQNKNELHIKKEKAADWALAVDEVHSGTSIS